MRLKVDPERASRSDTGVHVEAEYNGEVGGQDLARLDEASLRFWMRMSPGRAADLACLLLGHEKVHTIELLKSSRDDGLEAMVDAHKKLVVLHPSPSNRRLDDPGAPAKSRR